MVWKVKNGDKGEKGDKGDAGTGLTLRKFKLGQSYKKGDYVFAKAKRGHHHNSMFIAENDFTAEKYHRKTRTTGTSSVLPVEKREMPA